MLYKSFAISLFGSMEHLCLYVYMAQAKRTILHSIFYMLNELVQWNNHSGPRFQNQEREKDTLNGGAYIRNIITFIAGEWWKSRFPQMRTDSSWYFFHFMPFFYSDKF